MSFETFGDRTLDKTPEFKDRIYHVEQETPEEAEQRRREEAEQEVSDRKRSTYGSLGRWYPGMEKVSDKQKTIEKAPGDRWLLIRSGQAPMKSHKGEMPKEWLNTGGIILVGNEDGEWMSLLQTTGKFEKRRSPLEKGAEEMWSEIESSRNKLRSI